MGLIVRFPRPQSDCRGTLAVLMATSHQSGGAITRALFGRPGIYRKNASNKMIGSGTPNIHSKIPRPIVLNSVRGDL